MHHAPQLGVVLADHAGHRQFFASFFQKRSSSLTSFARFNVKSGDGFEEGTFGGAETIALGAVDVQDAGEFAGDREGDDDFAEGSAVADDVAGKFVDVGDNDGFVADGGGAADAAAERNAGTGGEALERAQNEGFALQEIKPGPVEAGEAGINQGGGVGGVGDWVGLAGEDGAELGQQVFILDGGGDAHAGANSRATPFIQ